MQIGGFPTCGQPPQKVGAQEREDSCVLDQGGSQPVGRKLCRLQGLLNLRVATSKVGVASILCLCFHNIFVGNSGCGKMGQGGSKGVGNLRTPREKA